MASIELSWTDFKEEATSRILNMQYVETTDLYYLVIFDGHLELNCVVPKEDPASADQTDFETNFKATANQTPTQAKPFADPQGYKSLLKGYAATAALNTTTNLDIPVIGSDVYLISLQLTLVNQGANDNADMVVIDKNNVLGNGANFIVDNWMSTWYFQSNNQLQAEIKSPFPLKIADGLFFRIIYRSTNLLAATTVKGNFYLYKKV